MNEANINKNSYILPVSSGQEHLWFLQELDERLGSAYNMTAAFKIQKTINRLALQKAINFVVARHESLRTAVCKVDGVLKQVVDPALVITINYVDYVANDSVDRHVQVVKEMQAEARKSFTLSSPGLVRFSLYRTQVDNFYFLMVVHHCISDGVSLEILIREIFTCYQQLLSKAEIEFPPLLYQFADIIEWQKEQITPDLEEQYISYWKNKLKGVNTIVQFSNAKKPTGDSSFAGEAFPFKFEDNFFNNISSLSKEMKVSPYCILFSAFALMIHYYSGQTDFLIGVPTVNRDNNESWTVVGYLANTIVIRVNLDAITTVKDLVLQVHETISEAISYQNLPISKIVNLLKPERSSSLSTIFQFMFSYQESPYIQDLLTNFNAEKLLINNGLSKFDIFLFILNQNNSLEGFIEYSTDLFENDYILRFIQHFSAICKTLSDNLSQSIYDTKLINGISIDEIHNRIKKAKNFNLSNNKGESHSAEEKHKNTPTEDEIINIWKKLLDTQIEISVTDNFFDIGGNSLLVTKMVDMINIKLNVSLPIKIIFLHPCVEKIAVYIDSQKTSTISHGYEVDELLQNCSVVDFEKIIEELD